MTRCNLVFSGHNVEVISSATAGYDSTSGVTVQGSEDVNILGRYAVQLNYLPQSLAVDAVESFHEINVIDYKSCLKLTALLDYVAKCEDLFRVGPSLLETSLIFS